MTQRIYYAKNTFYTPYNENYVTVKKMDKIFVNNNVQVPLESFTYTESYNYPGTSTNEGKVLILKKITDAAGSYYQLIMDNAPQVLQNCWYYILPAVQETVATLTSAIDFNQIWDYFETSIESYLGQTGTMIAKALIMDVLLPAIIG